MFLGHWFVPTPLIYFITSIKHKFAEHNFDVNHYKLNIRDVAFGCDFDESETKQYGLHNNVRHNIELCKRSCQKEEFCTPLNISFGIYFRTCTAIPIKCHVRSDFPCNKQINNNFFPLLFFAIMRGFPNVLSL